MVKMIEAILIAAGMLICVAVAILLTRWALR